MPVLRPIVTSLYAAQPHMCLDHWTRSREFHTSHLTLLPASASSPPGCTLQHSEAQLRRRGHIQCTINEFAAPPPTSSPPPASMKRSKAYANLTMPKDVSEKKNPEIRIAVHQKTSQLIVTVQTSMPVVVIVGITQHPRAEPDHSLVGASQRQVARVRCTPPVGCSCIRCTPARLPVLTHS